jgi:hypothetical protein
MPKMAKDTAENEARIARKKKKDDKNKVQKVKVNSDAIRDDDDDDDDDDNDEGEGEDDDNNADKIGITTGSSGGKTITTTTMSTSRNRPTSSLPTSIKVITNNTNGSQVSSSIPGLSSMLDMSMTELSESDQILIVKACVKNHMFPIWKFYNKEFHSQYSEDERSWCGFICKKTNLKPSLDRWIKMRKVVVKVHTDRRNNVIKNMQAKYKGL